MKHVPIIAPKNRMLAALAALLAAIASAAVIAPSDASAGTDLVTCTGQETVSWSPPLTNTPQDTTVTIEGMLGALGNPGSCVSVGTSVSSVSYREVFSFPNDSCTTAGINLPGSRVFTWDNGQSSTFTFTASIVNGVGTEIVTLTGTITAGRFDGDPAVETIEVPQLDPALCAGSGITSNSAQAELEILPL
jgi:hypothetical protein